jgi:hypothetical protein
MAVAQVYWEEDGEERESESNKRERRKRGRGVQVPSGGRLGLRRQAGGGVAIGPALDMQELASWRKKTMKILQRTP